RCCGTRCPRDRRGPGRCRHRHPDCRGGPGHCAEEGPGPRRPGARRQGVCQGAGPQGRRAVRAVRDHRGGRHCGPGRGAVQRAQDPPDQGLGLEEARRDGRSVQDRPRGQRAQDRRRVGRRCAPVGRGVGCPHHPAGALWRL
ncbi:hypothetical protein LPJ70_003366, partial [Coemansia sp. RSA 2708]